MIRVCAWYCAESCGVVTPDGRSNQLRAPVLLSTDDLPILIGRPIKYLPRMTTECRACLCAAGLAMKSCGWLEAASREIGLVGAGYEGCLTADQNYFQDYVASGRSLGRGNLFIYTLPTSTLGEIAIALGLTGPGLHIQAEKDPLGTLAQQATQFVEDGESDAMLALWSDAKSAVCLAIDCETQGRFELPAASNPTNLALQLASLVRSA